MKLPVVAFGVLLLMATVSGYQKSAIFADKVFLLKQKFVLEVLRSVHYPLQYDEYLPYTNSFVTDPRKYTNYTMAEEFFATTLMNKADIFTTYNMDHIQQTYQLFQFFCNSADWDTFYRNVIWARENINEGMFVYSLTLTVWHCPMLKGVQLPSISEIYPYYFHNADALQSAFHQRLQSIGKPTNKAQHVVYSNYSYFGEDPIDTEDQLNYFTEDTDLNELFYYYTTNYVFAMSKTDMFEPQSPMKYCYWLQQLIARYYLERQTNGLGSIKPFAWQQPIQSGYWPRLIYSNGVPFYMRNDDQPISSDHDTQVKFLVDYEQAARRIFDQGYMVLPGSDGIVIDMRNISTFDQFAAALGSRPDGINSNVMFEIMAHRAVSGDKYFVKNMPSAMMHFETSLRDPLYYQMYKYFIDIYLQVMKFLPVYTEAELGFVGLAIKDVAFDKLMTYFDYYDADVSNVLPQDDSTPWWDGTIFAHKKRINHKPFTYTLEVQVDAPVDGVVQMYMGPKYKNAKQLASIKDKFVLLDRYEYKFAAGLNRIVRHSRDYQSTTVEGFGPHYGELYRKVLAAYNGTIDQYETPVDIRYGWRWPNRLLLPKGRVSGYELTFYFIIVPAAYGNELPVGFPFNRPIDFSYFFTSNSIFKTVPIYHDE